MTPKARLKENNPLPKRWRFKHGAYYYRPRDFEKPSFDNKTEFRLGATLAEAHRVFADRIEWVGEIHLMGDLCDRYSIEVIPKKSLATQRSNIRSMQRIRSVFAKVSAAGIEPKHIYEYRDAVGKKYGEKSANLDLEVLSHVFTKSIEWGIRNDHPMTAKKVVKFSRQARDRYVEDWELLEAMKVAPPLIEIYVPLKLLLGLRKSELLSIQLSDLREDGIYAKRTKGGIPTIFEWTPTLRAAVEAIKAARKKVTGMYLFCTRTGQPYIKPDGTTSGFDSIWQRFMAAALAETKLEARFTEHDLRAKVGSEAENIERARELLGHRHSSTTQRAYRRKAVHVKPTA